MSKLPSGTVTFLFTDIEGSTTLWERSPQGMERSIERHNALLQQTIERHHGQVFKFVGDSFQAAFASPVDALIASIDAQRALSNTDWGEPGPIRVRMGMHIGSVDAGEYDYPPNHTLNRVARVMSAGHGGQILLSLPVAELVREHLPLGVELIDLGEHHLKGLLQPEHLFQVTATGLETVFGLLNVAPRLESLPFNFDAVRQRLRRGLLIGRDRERKALNDAWERAQDGEGGCLVISGEAGMGKTRLLAELVDLAAPSGGIILLGECYADGGTPLGPFADALRLLLGGISVQTTSGPAWQEYLGSGASDLLEIIPEYRRFFPGIQVSPSLAPDAQRRRLFESYAIFLDGLAAKSPCLLVLDDVQWADDPSLDLLLHLVRRLRRQPFLVAITQRNTDENPQLARSLSSLEHARLLQRLELGPLDRKAVAAMASGLLNLPDEPPRGFLDALYTRAEGNPFFVEELLRTIGDSVQPGALSHATLEQVGVPNSIGESIRWQFAELDSVGRYIATLGAVIGRRFDFDLLQSVAGMDQQTLMGGLRSLIQADMLIEQPQAAQVMYSFRNPLLHEVVYAESLAVERRLLHAQVGVEMERRTGFEESRLEAIRQDLTHYWWMQYRSVGIPAEVDQLARHFFLAGNWDKAFLYSRLAAERNTANFSERAALQLCNQALTLVADGRVSPSLAILVDVYTARGVAHWLLGNFKASIDDCEQALGLARQIDDWQREASALHWLSHTRLTEGEYEEAIRLVQESLRIAEDHDDQSGVAHLLLNLGEASISGVRGRREEGVAYLEKARVIYEAQGERYGLAHIEVNVGHMELIWGNYQTAIPHLQQAILLGEDLRDYWVLTMAHNYLGIALRDIGDYPGSQAHLHQAILVSESGDIESQAGFAQAVLASVFLLIGDYDQARRMAERSVQTLEAIQAKGLLPYALDVLGDVYRELGMHERALVSYERALPMAREVKDPCWEGLALAGHGLTRLRSAQVDLALADLNEAFSICNTTKNMYSRVTAEALTHLAAAHLAEGEGKDAIHLAGQALEISAGNQLCDLAAESQRLIGLAHAQQGNLAEAETTLGQAFNTVEGRKLPTLRWRLHKALGEVYLQQGKAVVAQGEFTAAANILRDLSQQAGTEAIQQTFLSRQDVRDAIQLNDASTN